MLQAWFVVAYVSHEQTVYFWDHAMYHGMAQNTWAAFQKGWGSGWAHLSGSMIQDYNVLFTLPSLISFFAFGTGRLVYIFTLFSVYFTAYQIATAFVIRRVYGLTWPCAFLASALLCSVLPPLWIPLFEGYPDIGAAAALTFALGLSLGSFSRRGSLLAFGFLLALAFILRRHYAYPALALLAVKFSFDFFDTINSCNGGSWKKSLLPHFARYALCGFAGLATVFLLAPGLVGKILATDYGALYKSYETTPSDFLMFGLSRFGFFLTLSATTGFVLAFRFLDKSRSRLRFLGVFVFTATGIWCLGPSQAGHHYLLHVLPVFFVSGLTGLFMVLWKLPNACLRKLYAGSLAFLLGLNAFWGLWFSPTSVSPDSRAFAGVASAPRPPAVRTDINQLVSLAAYLSQTTKPEDRVYAIGSSFIFNQDIVRAVYTDILQQYEPLQNMLFGPEIDSRDDSPLHTFAQASVYVVPNAPQYHLRPDAQKIIGATTAPFLTHEVPKNLFRLDDRVFELDKGVGIRIWRRKPWTPEALHAMLGDIRREAPLIHPDWIITTPYRDISVKTLGGGLSDVALLAHPPETAIALFFDSPISSGDYTLRFLYGAQGSCQNATFRILVQSPKGHKILEQNFRPLLVPGHAASSFSLAEKHDFPAFITLFVNIFSKDGSPPCLATLGGLSILKD